MKSLITVKEITKSFPIRGSKKRNLALSNLSLEIYAGEFLAIVGESGSGKSTLAKILLGITKPDSGQVWRQEGLAARSIQMILQNPYAAFDPLATMESSLVEVLLANRLAPNRQAAKAQIIELMPNYGLEPKSLSKRGREFSGGQLQRFGILRAMLLKPRVLLADEIISALDGQRKLSILELLKDLQVKEGLSIVFITHDIAGIQNFAERIVVMKDGKIVEAKSCRELILEPENEYTKKLLAAVPKI
ncbi:MAG: ATP-binding cassette domain-containing protein [Eubacteriales bacterium]|nr:ATP-binding cassette domain-containing protein [Eubacteriales bacterium]